MIKTASACKRCRSKKLKCDITAVTCGPCHRSKEKCITVDAISGRQYPRDYIDSLQARAQYLRSFIKDPELQGQGLLARSASIEVIGANDVGHVSGDRAQVSSIPRPSISPKFTGEGSFASLGQLVAAAVSTKDSDYQTTRRGNTETEEQNTIERFDATRTSLPSLPAAQQLLSSYLNGPHVLHPFLKRSEVHLQVSNLYNSQHSNQDPEDLFRINMIFAIGAVSLTRMGLHQTPPIDYYLTAMEHAEAVLGLTGYKQVQNTLLILLFALQHDIGIGSKWDLSRLAMRICIQNEFHQPPKTTTDPMIEQMQRRMFWCSYVADRHSSSTLGRPVAIADEDISVEFPLDFDDNDIENRTFNSPDPAPISEVSVLLRQIRLRQITSKIRTELYLKKAVNSPDENEAIVYRLREELEEWRNSSPLFLYPKNPYETTAWLNLNFFRESMTIFRSQVVGTSPNEQYLRYCLNAATSVISSYQALSTSDKLVINWTCVHDMVSSGFMVLYCGIYIHRSIHRNDDQSAFYTQWDQEKASILSAIDGCCQILSHISGYWKTVEKHLVLFQRLSREVSKLMQSNPSDVYDAPRPVQPARMLQEVPETLDANTQEYIDSSLPFDFSVAGLPVDNFGLSDIELAEIFGPDFQGLDWDWNMPV